MTMKILKTCGASLAAITLGLSLVATPALARGDHIHGGGGGFGGNGFHGGGGFHGGFHGGGFHGDHFHGYGGGWNGGYGGWDNGYDYAAPAIGLGLLGGALLAAPYYNGYGAYYDQPQPVEPGNDVAYCEAHFKSYNPATGTYLGYDGLRHPCP